MGLIGALILNGTEGITAKEMLRWNALKHVIATITYSFPSLLDQYPLAEKCLRFVTCRNEWINNAWETRCACVAFFLVKDESEIINRS